LNQRLAEIRCRRFDGRARVFDDLLRDSPKLLHGLDELLNGHLERRSDGLQVADPWLGFAGLDVSICCSGKPRLLGQALLREVLRLAESSMAQNIIKYP
jgi:hypothetical protein